MKIKFLLVLIFFINCFQIRNSSIKKGILDLSNIDFSYDLIIKLNGEWKFYWKQLPEDIRLSKKNEFTYVSVPSRWNNNLFKIKENLGYATYELKIINNFNEDSLAIYIPTVISAYEVYINYEKITSLGKISLEPEGFQPQNYPIRVNVIGKPKEILLQIVAYDQIFGQGGIDEPILLSSVKNIKSHELLLNFLDSFTIGFLFCIAILHLLYFSLDTSKKAFLFLGLCVIFIGVRELFIEQKILVSILKISFLTTYKIDNISKMLTTGFFIGFTQALFPNEISKRFVKISLLIFFSLSVAFLFFSYYELFFGDIVFRFVFPAIVLYFLNKIRLAYINDRPDSGIYIASFSLISVVAVNDILYSFKIIETGYYLIYSYILFLLLQSFIVSRQNIRAFFEIQMMEERLRKISKVKDEFMSNLSHEMRTPLSLIYAFSELIVDRNYSNIETLRSYGEEIYRESKYLIEIINDLMLITDLETKYSLNLKDCSIKEILEEAIAYLENLRSEKNISIETLGDGNLKMFCDKSLILKVFIIVIKNSILYNKQDGSVKISWEPEKQFIHFRVADTGHGIPKKDLPFVFDKFYRVDSSITYKVSGVGVGLFLAKKSIELHEGDIYIESKIGEGTTVHLLIPASKKLIA